MMRLLIVQTKGFSTLRTAASVLSLLAFVSFSSAQVRVDLSGVFTTDVIFNNVDITGDTGGYFDPPGPYNLIVGGSNLFPVDGLPTNGQLTSTADMGTYQLGSYSGMNCIQLGSTTVVDIDVANGNYTKLGILAATANGDAAITLVVHYADGSSDTFTEAVLAPDWFNHSLGLPEIVTGMDRVQWTGTRWTLDDRDSPAIFEAFIFVDPNRVVDRIVIGTGFFSNPARTQAGIFAVNAMKSDFTAVQLNISSGYNIDAIWDGSGLTTDSAGFFDQPNRYNYTVGAGPTFPTDGLPTDGVVTSRTAGLGTYQLGDYTGLNAIQITSASSPMMIDVPDGQYRRLGFLTSNANGSAQLALTIVYTDSSQDTGLVVQSPDWFNHGTGTPEVITGMDRTRWSGTKWLLHDANSPAVFETVINVNRSKEVSHIMLGAFVSGSGQSSTLALNAQHAADLDNNGCVDDADLLIVLFAFGTGDPAADVNGDGLVDDGDLLIVLFNFGAGC
jgi:hypothetical protein